MTGKKLYKSPDKKISGVCAGIADYFNIDPTVVRIIAASLAFLSVGTAAVIYLVFALALENPPANYYEIYRNTSKRVTKSSDKKLAGVCGGIAEALNIDPAIVRLIWGLVTALTAVVPGTLAYIVAACIMPKSPEGYNTGYNQGYNQGYQNPNGHNNGYREYEQYRQQQQQRQNGQPNGQGAPNGQYNQGNQYNPNGQSNPGADNRNPRQNG